MRPLMAFRMGAEFLYLRHCIIRMYNKRMYHCVACHTIGGLVDRQSFVLLHKYSLKCITIKMKNNWIQFI